MEPDRLVAWAGVLGSPVVLLCALLFSIGMPVWLGYLLVAAFVGGFLYLVADEWRMSTGRKPRPDANRRQADQELPGQRARSIPPSTGSITPDTKDAAGESRKAAARPNSSGSP